jgi:hypothetical protein
MYGYYSGLNQYKTIMFIFEIDLISPHFARSSSQISDDKTSIDSNFKFCINYVYYNCVFASSYLWDAFILEDEVLSIQCHTMGFKKPPSFPPMIKVEDDTSIFHMTWTYSHYLADILLRGTDKRVF